MKFWDKDKGDIALITILRTLLTVFALYVFVHIPKTLDFYSIFPNLLLIALFIFCWLAVK